MHNKDEFTSKKYLGHIKTTEPLSVELRNLFSRVPAIMKSRKLDVLSLSTVTLRPLSSTSRVLKNLRRRPVVGIVKNEKMSKKENIFPFCITGNTTLTNIVKAKKYNRHRISYKISLLLRVTPVFILGLFILEGI